MRLRRSPPVIGNALPIIPIPANCNVRRLVFARVCEKSPMIGKRLPITPRLGKSASEHACSSVCIRFIPPSHVSPRLHAALQLALRRPQVIREPYTIRSRPSNAAWACLPRPSRLSFLPEIRLFPKIAGKCNTLPIKRWVKEYI